MEIHVSEVLVLTSWSRTRLYDLTHTDERLKSSRRFGRACWKLEDVMTFYAEKSGEEPPTQQELEFYKRFILEARVAAKKKTPEKLQKFASRVHHLR